jgi:hypothetical protein
MWLIASAAWIVTFLLVARLRRSRPYATLRVVPTRKLVRAIGGVLVASSWATALVLIASVILAEGHPADDLPVSEAVAAVFIGMAVLTYFQNLLAYSDLTITDEGIRLPHLLVPWTAIEAVSMRGNVLEIVTPNLRRSWNGWTGRLAVYSMFWDITDEALRLIEGRIQHKRAV